LRDLGIPTKKRSCGARCWRRRARLRRRSLSWKPCSKKRRTRRRRASFLDDAGEQLLIRKGPALRQYIDKEYEALGKLAKALNLAPQ